VFRAEGREWRCIEKRPEENEFVEAARGMLIAAQKNRGQSDGENGSADAIRPNDLSGNSEYHHKKRDNSR